MDGWHSSGPTNEAIHGDQWATRLRREHERHAGLPTASWWCPGRSRIRPEVREITSAQLQQQRDELRRRDHRAEPVEDRGLTVCGICRKPVRTWPDGRFPIHASA